MEIVVSGASGLIGSELAAELRAGGHRVIRLVRDGTGGGDTVAWDPAAATIDAAALEGIDAAVHLAGESIGPRRWTAAKKAAILDSRVKGTTLLAEALAGLDRPPQVLVCASGMDFYAPGEELRTEASPPGTGFLAEVGQAWEAATAPAVEAGIRVVTLRTGIVLSARGGALKQMLLPFKLGVGGRQGTGRQWMSWIALADEVGAIVHLLSAPDVAGPVNLASPNPVRNADFAKALGRAVRRPAVLPLPAFALKLLLGAEMAEELLLTGQRVVPERLLGSGYRFRHPDLPGALKAALEP